MQLTEHKTEQIPDFLLLGAAKSGTTSLFFYLAQHPDIFLPTTFKEPGYLCFAGRPTGGANTAAPYPDMWSAVISNRTEYSKLFAAAKPNQIIGEATPEYLYLHDKTIENIRTLYGTQASDLKYIAILRNPVTRIWSHYWMFRRDGYETLPFAEATSPETINARLKAGWHPSYDYIGFGKFAPQISAWQQAFGKERLKVVLLEDLQEDSVRVCADLFSFLGVATEVVPNTSINYNLSGDLRRIWLHNLLLRRQYFVKDVIRRILPERVIQAAKQRLLAWNTEKVRMPAELIDSYRSLYRDDIRALQLCIDRDLSAWL